jgi:hypothetical protein
MLTFGVLAAEQGQDQGGNAQCIEQLRLPVYPGSLRYSANLLDGKVCGPWEDSGEGLLIEASAENAWHCVRSIAV